jgi:steroid delta-isomerase-like uncharacterized protein
MSGEENRAIALRLYEEIINTGDFDRAEEVLSPNFVEHEEVPVPADLQGIDAFKQFFSMLRGAFPDMRMDVQDMIAEGDKVVARLTVHGTHQGEFMGMPPTDNPIEVTATDIFRIGDGKIVDHWGNIDNLGMMQQLGAIPPPGQTGRS